MIEHADDRYPPLRAVALRSLNPSTQNGPKRIGQLDLRPTAKKRIEVAPAPADAFRNFDALLQGQIRATVNFRRCDRKLAVGEVRELETLPHAIPSLDTHQSFN